jgi:hypothetical protein
MKHRLSIVALVFGLLAVGLASFQNNFVHTSPQPHPSEDGKTLKEVAADAAKKLLREKVLHDSPPAKSPADSRRQPLHPYQMLYTSLGVLAIGLGIYAWTQKAQTRLAAAAIGLGLIAIAWEWVLFAVGIAVVVFFLSLLG